MIAIEKHKQQRQQAWIIENYRIIEISTPTTTARRNRSAVSSSTDGPRLRFPSARPAVAPFDDDGSHLPNQRSREKQRKRETISRKEGRRRKLARSTAKKPSDLTNNKTHKDNKTNKRRKIHTIAGNQFPSFVRTEPAEKRERK